MARQEVNYLLNNISLLDSQTSSSNDLTSYTKIFSDNYDLLFITINVSGYMTERIIPTIENGNHIWYDFFGGNSASATSVVNYMMSFRAVYTKSTNTLNVTQYSKGSSSPTGWSALRVYGIKF